MTTTDTRTDPISWSLDTDDAYQVRLSFEANGSFGFWATAVLDPAEARLLAEALAEAADRAEEAEAEEA